MSTWPAVKAKRLFAALTAIGWSLKRQSSSHRVPQRDGWGDVVFAFHDGEEIGPKMLARMSRKTGLRPEDV